MDRRDDYAHRNRDREMAEKRAAIEQVIRDNTTPDDMVAVLSRVWAALDSSDGTEAAWAERVLRQHLACDARAYRRSLALLQEVVDEDPGRVNFGDVMALGAEAQGVMHAFVREAALALEAGVAEAACRIILERCLEHASAESGE